MITLFSDTNYRMNLRREKKFLSLIFILVSMISFGQIQTKIDTTHIKIGEPIHYSLEIPIHSQDKIELPQLKDTLTFHLEILDQKIDTILEGEQKKLIQRLSITSYDPGDFLVRSLPVVINSDTILTASFQIKVDEVKIDSANLAGYPIKPIMEEEYTWKDYWDKYWIYVIVAIAVFVILLIVAILFLRDKKRRDSTGKIIKTPYEEALEALKNIDKKKYLEKGQVYPFYSELSFLLRRYLGRVYHFSSLELLSDDLVDYFKKSTHLQENDVKRLKEFLYDSDLVKYAKAIPDQEKHAFYRKWVEDLIERTKPMELEDETVQELKPNERYRKIK